MTTTRNVMLSAMVCVLALACKTLPDSQLLEESDDGLPNAVVEKALQAVGADWPGLRGESRCGGACHVPSWHKTITKRLLTEDWAGITRPMTECFQNASDAASRINCFRDESTGVYKPKQLGLYRAGAHTSFFKQMFAEAFPDPEEARKEYALFLNGKDAVPPATMPVPSDAENASSPVSEEEFEAIRMVIEHPRGFEKMASFFATVEDNFGCTTEVTPALLGYLRSRDSRHGGTSWFDVNMERVQQREMTMFGCRYNLDDFDPFRDPVTKCFRPNDPEANWNDSFHVEWAKTWSRVRDESGEYLEQNIRVLSDLRGYNTTYWMRSSADGRFVGNGLTGVPANEQISCNSRLGFILDLKKGNDGRQTPIFVNAPYDPGFCPDNKCFTFISGGTAYFCSQKLLYPDPSGNRSTCLELNRLPRHCTDGKMGVYQHVGASLDGEHYKVVRSDFYSNDDGGNMVFRDPDVGGFAKNHSEVEIYVMCEAGERCSKILADYQGVSEDRIPRTDSTYGVSRAFRINIPYEGDFGISPSGSLLSSRIASKAEKQIGYRIRDFDLKSLSSKPLATICMKGGKANFSHNERFLVTHHYVDADDWQELNRGLPESERFDGPSDPRFKKYLHESSNIYLADLATGKVQRLTFTRPGQYALYPHFRADGWLYFLVRDRSGSTPRDVVVATDAAIRMSLANPLPAQ